ncbi:alternate-type signal peptide domain-containing protein [Georgenia subflava]|uniref:Alternate-type signal peptide domain-containing protein n=1 Tax=Georgenia subflava TaxID=1622177 RepID=A0A6N7ECU4_9MICO|nr:alternate-type signal peptide domain-containing protein [Georgenia subflava]MPV36242.1 alternate-type signal peptide domain-containing protein [Georgenia subflava]
MTTSHTATRSSSSKFGKALLVAGAGVALLAGGATTFANWYDETSVGRGEISTGELRLNNGNGVWSNANGPLASLDGYHVIPGETLTYRETVTVEASGDLLDARLTTSFDAGQVFSGGDADLAAALLSASSFSVNDAELADFSAPIADSTAPQTFAIELDVTFPADISGQALQNVATTLSDVHVEVRQGAVQNG